MDRGEIISIVRARVGRLLGGAEQIGDSDLLSHHGLDSLLSVELTLDLEEAFSVAFEDDELTFERFESIGLIADLLAAKVGVDA
jgi:acyl carrier protein